LYGLVAKDSEVEEEGEAGRVSRTEATLLRSLGCLVVAVKASLGGFLEALAVAYLRYISEVITLEFQIENFTFYIL
jgi:hypothetical protein